MTPETRIILSAALQLTPSQIKSILRINECDECTVGHLSRSLNISRAYLQTGLISMSMAGLTVQEYRWKDGGRQLHWKLAPGIEQSMIALAATVEITDLPTASSIPQAA